MIVDAQNQFMRSYIVNPSLTPNGDPVGGVTGFMKIMNKLCRQVQPDEFVIVWDGAGGSQKRRAINKNYKEGRKPPKLNRFANNLSFAETEQNKIWRQARTIEYINCTPMIQFREDGVEADDVISFISQSPVYNGWQKVIVSSDKDFIQLLNEETLLFRPVQDEVLNVNRILETTELHPRNFALVRSIVGDKSDNLPGVMGLGLKKVAKAFPFLSEDADYLISDLEEYSQSNLDSKIKTYEKVLDNLDLIRQNYKIMQLSNPNMSVQMTRRITHTLNEWVPEFNKTELRMMMFQDGFGDVNLDCLYRKFNTIILESKTEEGQ